MKKVVVSAIFQGHDYIKDPIFLNPEWDYVLFTDDENIVSDYWQVQHIGGNRERARDIKINTHKYLKYDVRLWVDASMVLKCDPEDLLTEMGDNDMLFKIHPRHDTIAEELKGCVKAKRITEEMALMVEADMIQRGVSIKRQNEVVNYETGLNMIRNTSQAIAFCEKWYNLALKYWNRDQLALPIIICEEKPKYQFFTEAEYLAWVLPSMHNSEGNYLPYVHYMSPYATDGNLGAAYNDAAELLEDDEWICIHDQDICFLDSRLKLWIAKTIEANPDYTMFTCTTNRLSDTQQLVNGMFGVADIKVHKQVTLKQWKVHGTTVREATRPTAGLFMLMRASTVKGIRFKNGLAYIDTDFYNRLVEAGGKVGIMLGIYVFHYYRLNEGKSDTRHLRRLQYV